VLLGEVDAADGCLIEELDLHVLADAKHDGRLVTDQRGSLVTIPATTGEVVEVLTVDAGRAAVAAESVEGDELAEVVTQTTQRPTGESAGVGRVDVEAVILHLTECLVEVLSEVLAGAFDHDVASGDGPRDEGRVEPGSRLVLAEEDSRVQDTTEFLSHQRTNLAPDVEV